ncbi:MAG: hypothetical protein UU76_C0033G0002 [Parcubacteria group bacterium GW2011_GWC1_41_7]|nr:MAG: hypothetical protein UU76_C0033G0002 [Parcubacteria group bacterium GW2011_GWC1_41_7]
MNQQYKRIFIEGVLLIAIIAMVYILKSDAMARAGVLTPATTTAPTMMSGSDIYSALVGTNFSSATLTPTMNGNALQVTRCVIKRVEGEACN